jgi:hypothetical protein
MPSQDELFPITLRHTTVGTTPSDEITARRGDNTYKRHTSMPQVEFEPANPASNQSLTLASDLSINGMDEYCYSLSNIHEQLNNIKLRKQTFVIHWQKLLKCQLLCTRKHGLLYTSLHTYHVKNYSDTSYSVIFSAIQKINNLIITFPPTQHFASAVRQFYSLDLFRTEHFMWKF